LDHNKKKQKEEKSTFQVAAFICFDAAGSQHGSFTIPGQKGYTVGQVALKYISGGVSCDARYYAVTPWGCYGYQHGGNIYVIVTNERNQLVWPKNATTVCFEPSI
jgi:hypothetical protein